MFNKHETTLQSFRVNLKPKGLQGKIIMQGCPSHDHKVTNPIS